MAVESVLLCGEDPSQAKVCDLQVSGGTDEEVGRLEILREEIRNVSIEFKKEEVTY